MTGGQFPQIKLKKPQNHQNNIIVVVERIRKDPALWENLFPFDLRRELALNLTDRAAGLPFVGQILAVDLELEEVGVNISTLFIIVDDCVTPLETGQLERAYLDICPDGTSRNVLGHVIITSADNFTKKRFDSFFRYKETTIVYEREQEPTALFDRPNLNCCLN